MPVKRPSVYLAGPLFTQAERTWNRQLADALAASGFQMLVPQVLSQELIGKTGEYNPGALFRRAATTVERADVVLAILDGADADSGTAFECGVAWGKGIPVVGLRTDLRQGGDGTSDVNLMLSESCHAVVFADALSLATAADVAGKVEPALRAALLR